MPLAVRMLAVAVLLSFLAPLPATAQTYRLTQILSPAESDPRCRSDYARLLYAANDRPARLGAGIAAGSVICYETSAQNPATATMTASRAFAWTVANGGYYLSDEPAAASGVTPGVVAAKATVVGASRFANGDSSSIEAVRWINGVMERLSNTAATECDYGWATAINRGGVIAGYMLMFDPATGDCAWTAAFRRQSGEIVTAYPGTRAYAISDSGVIAGVYSGGILRWDTNDNSFDDLVHRGRDFPTDIDNSRQVVGYGSTGILVECVWGHQAVFYQNSRGRRVLASGIPGAQINKAYAINERGQIVGTSLTDYSCGTGSFFLQNNGRAILWSPPADNRDPHVPVDLNSRIDAKAGVVLTEALDINDAGQILASGYFAAEPMLPCPMIEIRLTGSREGVVETPVFNPKRMCRQQHLFRLMPNIN